jgi:hypothetical protein
LVIADNAAQPKTNFRKFLIAGKFENSKTLILNHCYQACPRAMLARCLAAWVVCFLCASASAASVLLQNVTGPDTHSIFALMQDSPGLGWADASSSCASMGALLASFRGGDLSLAAASLSEPIGWVGVYSGGGNFLWTDGRNFTGNISGNGQCVHANSSGFLTAVACTTILQQYICQVRCTQQHKIF